MQHQEKHKVVLKLFRMPLGFLKLVILLRTTVKQKNTHFMCTGIFSSFCSYQILQNITRQTNQSTTSFFLVMDSRCNSRCNSSNSSSSNSSSAQRSGRQCQAVSRNSNNVHCCRRQCQAVSRNINISNSTSSSSSSGSSLFYVHLCQTASLNSSSLTNNSGGNSSIQVLAMGRDSPTTTAGRNLWIC